MGEAARERAPCSSICHGHFQLRLSSYRSTCTNFASPMWLSTSSNIPLSGHPLFDNGSTTSDSWNKEYLLR
ncbi:conserved hypothetical protein [Ricinus communis]|uniref:Uncharacterized protein n=1 Tax=Ricinus communis TaxID=3988 RepID=B9S8E4_RICCO|nr:conserved hypothetical protein [Ricinus communis]